MSCSSGGGSAPSMWVGVQGGNSDIEGGDLTADQADDFLQAGLGFTIPLGSPGNKVANCNEVMAILEAEEFIKMIQQLFKANISIDWGRRQRKQFTGMASSQENRFIQQGSLSRGE